MVQHWKPEYARAWLLRARREKKTHSILFADKRLFTRMVAKARSDNLWSMRSWQALCKTPYGAKA